MKASRLAGAFAVLVIAAAARAQSPIPGGNWIDDFGSLTPSTTSDAPAVVATGHSSPVPMNYIDDFGPLVPASIAAQEELGAAGGEPGAEAKAAARARDGAVLEARDHERFVHDVWASP